MKKILSKLMGGVLLFSLSMSLTSCEGALDDILGEWSRPTPGSSTGGAVTSIDLDADEMKLTVGDKGQLTAKVDPAGTAVTWSSDKEEIATVDANGLVTAVAMGTAIITAKAGDKEATCEVTVTAGLSTPLTLEVLTAGTIIVFNPLAGMQYSLNGGAKKNVPNNTPIEGTGLNVGDKVEFYGTDTDYSSTKINDGTAVVKVYGNIMSLVYADFSTNYETVPAVNTFAGLFYNNTGLKDASGLLLPATTLKDGCYNGLLQDCTSLTTAPKELPATTLKTGCYGAMFNGCTSLTTAPELKGMTLADQCYYEMFKGCTSLTTAPELKAMTLAEDCYRCMFQGCTSLTTAPELPATTLVQWCYAQMFQNCTSLIAAPELKAETLKPSCYNQMFFGCSKLSSVTCLATTLDSNGCNNWLYGAGTDASVTSRTLHIKTGQDISDGNWKLDSSGEAGKRWTAVADQ